MHRIVFVIAALIIALSPVDILSQGYSDYAIVTFDSITTLDDYAHLGITFYSGTIWHAPQHPSIYEREDGGARSMPNALCINDCYSGTGSIFFHEDLNIQKISIWALSGPGWDFVSPSMMISAYDQYGDLLATVDVSDNVQYEQVIIEVAADSKITRLDLTAGPEGDCWDDLELWGNPVVPTEESSLGAIKKLFR